MSFYQLVLRNGLGETEHVVLVDNQDAAGFTYRGQSLEDGALIELDHGAMYVVVEERAEDGHRRFLCDPFDDGTLENLPPVSTVPADQEQAGFFGFWRDVLPSPVLPGPLPDIRHVPFCPPPRPPWLGRSRREQGRQVGQ